MKSFRSVLLLLIIGLIFTSTYAQTTAQEDECGEKASEFLQSEKCSDIDLSESNCTDEMLQNCFEGDNTLYNDYVCCNLDVSSKRPENGRKLKQGSSCFRMYTSYAISYESRNIVDILKYCIAQGYKTNYSAVIGDPSILDALNDEPSEAEGDRAPPSKASTYGFGALFVVALVLGYLL